jgi:hypothetical protein
MSKSLGEEQLKTNRSYHKRSWHGIVTPFLTLCLHIYLQYNFFIISSLFPLFNLFVSITIFMQSYFNSNLHVLTLCTLMFHKVKKFLILKIVYLLTSCMVNVHCFQYVIETRTCINYYKTYLDLYT